ncbi:MAG: NusG domain II-containing protein [Anaerovoracaceae bacterium]
MIKKKYITFPDIILIIFLALLGLGATFFLSFSQKDGKMVQIYQEGKEYGTYPLSEDRKIPIQQGDQFNLVLIEGGHVSVEDSNCPGKDCVHQHHISQSNQVITCLPHKVVIEVKGGESQFDAISQ